MTELFASIQRDCDLWAALLREHPLLWLPTLICLVPCIRIVLGLGLIIGGYSVIALGWVFMMIVNFKTSRSRREMVRRGWE